MKLSTKSIVTMACVLVSLCSVHWSAEGQIGENSGHQAALAAIFADDHIAESALSVHKRAGTMSASDRYEFLTRWVLPPDPANPIRLQVDFSPSNPASIALSAHQESGRRISAGGEILSRALDLIDAAAELNKLDLLRERIERIKPTSLLSTKNRAAMLAMILLKQNKLDEAMQFIDQFSVLSAEEQPIDQTQRAAEAALLIRCQEFDELRELLLENIDRVINQQKLTSSRATWIRQFRSLQAVRQQDASSADIAESSSPPQWQSSSTMSAETRGEGIPMAQWKVKKGRADNTISHGTDYLYYCSPLTGDFQIECDVCAFSWAETRLMACGVWVSPVYDHLHYDVGNIRDLTRRFLIKPPLKSRDVLHYRTEVRQGTMTTSINGRIIHSQQVEQNCDPWVAIRSADMQEGTATNVRITGAPKISETISLSSSPTLAGWIAYFGESAGEPEAQWRCEDSIIHASRRPAFQKSRASMTLPSVYDESAILYHRPMLEDGTIDYEFFYREGEVVAHPMMDRLCFLIDPAGIKIHWLTDGPFERTDLAPDNATSEAANRRGPAKLPLLNNAWNRASVSLNDDVIELTLNGELVYQRPLEATNQRQFGFFHYADQSELQVRNVRWTGNWPRTLPSIADQQLAVEEAEFLDQNIDHLTASFTHNFARDGFQEERFAIVHGSRKELQETPDGLHALRSGASGYLNTTIAPSLQLHGDFDVTLAYDQYESSPSVKGSSSLMLITMLENPTSDEFFITRRHMFYAAENEQQLVQCATVQKSLDGEKRDYFVTKDMEERAGRLRLARRGKMVYFLSAEGDSPNFRIWGSRELSDAPTQMNGIRLVNQIHEAGSSSVVWKSVSIRAEKLTGTAVDDTDARLVTLNEQREKLPSKVVYDFAKEAPALPTLYRWRDTREWTPADKGMKVLAEGFDTWESAGLCTLDRISGDFDIQVDFETLNMATPSAGSSTDVYLQIQLTDPAGTAVNAIWSLDESSETHVTAKMKTTLADGSEDYRNLAQLSTNSVSSLRIARRGESITILIRQPDSVQDRIIAEVELNDTPISRARVLLHTGGANRESELLLKKFEVAAEKYQTGQVIAPPNPKPAAKGFFESLLEAIK